MMSPVGTAPDTVVGREVEVRAVGAMLDAAQQHLAVLSLQGEPGIGKTTVWRQGLLQAAARGMRVLQTRPTQAEASLSFAGLTDLFSAVDSAVFGRLPPPQREAIAAALLQASAPRRGIDERALFAAVLSLLRLLASDGPLLIAVDDAQWLDTPSSRALGFAVRRLQPEPVGVLTTVRTGTSASPTFDSAADAEARLTLTLGPLSVAALHDAIKQHTGRSLPRPAVVRLARFCNGNPFFALAIAADLGDEPIDAGKLRVPPSLMDVVSSRVRRLPATTRQALLTAALLSRPTLDLVDHAGIEPARRAGMVAIDSGSVVFTHPLFASAIQQQASGAEQREVHRRLAGVVTEPEERARHAALGAEAPDAAIAATLESAAISAKARGAPASAAELLELAIGLTPEADQDQRGTRRVAAAACWFDAGDLARAEQLLDDALATGIDRSVRARALHDLSQLQSRRSSYGRAIEVAHQALEAAADDPALTAEAEMDVAYYHISIGDVSSSVAHTTAAVRAAERSGIPSLLADALAVSTMADFVSGQGMDEARILRARTLEDPRRTRAWQMAPAFVHGSLLLYVGRVEEAVAVLGELHRASQERGEESAIPYSCFWLTWAALWHGDFGLAGLRAEEALQTAPLLDDPAANAIALTTAALYQAHAGSVDLVRQHAAAALSRFEELGWMVASIYALWALGLAELSADNPDGVDAALGSLAEQVCAIPGEPFLGAFLPVEVEALVELGQLDRADRYLRWLEERAAAVDRAWARAAAARCRGLVLAAGGEHEAAQAALGEALLQHSRDAIPFERARTLLVAGQLHRRRREKRLAATHLQEAQHVFVQLGANRWAARARSEIERLGLRPQATDRLTATERRIAELAAGGLSNREIAERAFLTTKAVESNLTRVYHKLRIRSRGGLGRALQHIASEATTDH